MSPEVVFSPSTMERKKNEKTQKERKGGERDRERKREISGTEQLEGKGRHWSPGGRNLTKPIPTIHCY
jgi:hypothetical protein